ncbi:hypothetical protein QQP08_010462 [Theobroma cacao]|nr:hypothetical protein QQP08_010462 [Theobroma cacao]
MHFTCTSICGTKEIRRKELPLSSDKTVVTSSTTKDEVVILPVRMLSLVGKLQLFKSGGG